MQFQFQTQSNSLLKNLSATSSAIGKNPVLPILENFLWEIENGILTITATDLENTITAKVEVSTMDNFAVCIPAKILTDTLKALPNQSLTFTFTGQNDVLSECQIKGEKGKYKMGLEKADDFPQQIALDDANNITLDSSVILDSLNATTFAMSSDELRPAMTGVLFDMSEKGLTAVATDAHRLGQFKKTIEGGFDGSFIAPRKAVVALKSLLTSSCDVNIEVNKSNVSFQFKDIKIVSKLIDARYPDYNQVIPLENPNVVKVNRKDFLSSLKRTAIYANKTTNQVVVKITDGNIELSSQDLDYSNSASEEIPCELTGEEITIGFNGKFLIEGLNVMSSEEVTLSLSGPTRAGVIQPVGEEEGESFKILAMPVMLG